MATKYAHNTVDLSDTSTTWGKVGSVVQNGDAVLDIGCSSGYLGERLVQERNATVWGIEYDKDDAQEAKDRGFSKVFVGDVEKFEWSKLGKQRFNVMVFADILEHLMNPAEVLRQASKFLVPGGIVVISVPNIAHLSVRIELMAGNFIYEPRGILDNTHTKYFTKDTILGLVQEGGLHPFKVDHSINDLPADYAQKELKKIGLEATPKFQKIVESESARAFQYVVFSSNQPAKKPLVTAPLPQKSLEEVSQLRSHIVKQGKELDKLREIKRLYDESQQKAATKPSLSRRIKTKARSVRNRLK